MGGGKIKRKPRITELERIRAKYRYFATPRRAECGHVAHIISKATGNCMECQLIIEKREQRAPKRG